MQGVSELLSYQNMYKFMKSSNTQFFGKLFEINSSVA